MKKTSCPKNVGQKNSPPLASNELLPKKVWHWTKKPEPREFPDVVICTVCGFTAALPEVGRARSGRWRAERVSWLTKE